MKNKKFFVGLVLFLCSVFAFADSTKTNIEGLFRKTLDNGLEVFVMENNSAPLAYIEIAVRAGSVTQTPGTAGLFHLYEHLMFKGNSKYPNQEKFNEAMNKLGVGDWNGTTGVDRVNYFFTIPSDVVRDGMEFWSYAIRSPKIDKDELEREKGVVLSEINGNISQPNRIAYAGFSSYLFNEPWRVDSGGNPTAVSNATVEQMKDIQSKFYVPENSALFIGGDVKHDEIFKYAQEIFGDWKCSSSKIIVKTQAKKISDEVKKIVYSNPTISDSFVSIRYTLRGPDGEDEQSDTYPADVWGNLLDDPNGKFSNMFVNNKILSIPDSDYIGAGYYTQRTSGMINFNAYCMNDGNPVEKGEEFIRVIENDITDMMLNDSDFTKNIKSAEQKLEDSRIYELETATGILSSLSFMFASCDADYFFNYDEKISNVTEDDVRNFVKKYINQKKGVLFVSVSPNVFEKYKDDFEKNNYSVITSDNAFWWKK